MRPRLPPAPPEMPARLRCFAVEDWSDPGDDPALADYWARRRHTAAWLAWCHDHGADPLAMLRRRRNDRRVAEGFAPIDYD